MGNIKNLDAFTCGYLRCALFTGTDESTPAGGIPLDDAGYTIDCFDDESIAKAVKDCEAFQKANAHLLDRAGDDEQNGMDFYYDRNRHGVGFLDRDYSEGIADLLHEAAQKFGEVSVFVGQDNETLYFS